MTLPMEDKELRDEFFENKLGENVGSEYGDLCHAPNPPTRIYRVLKEYDVETIVVGYYGADFSVIDTEVVRKVTKLHPKVTVETLVVEMRFRSAVNGTEQSRWNSQPRRRSSCALLSTYRIQIFLFESMALNFWVSMKSWMRYCLVTCSKAPSD